MQSTGQTSTQALHKVHDHVSIIYKLLFLNIAFSGQIKLQLSQEIQSELISRYGIMYNIVAKVGNC